MLTITAHAHARILPFTLRVGHFVTKLRSVSSTQSDKSYRGSVSPKTFADFLRDCGLSDKRLCQELYPLEQGQRAPNDEFPIAVACSGGADSVALMLLLKEYMQENQIKTPLLAVTVDHRLRFESSKEALEVAKLCTDCGGIKHIIEVCDWHLEKAGKQMRGGGQNDNSRSVTPRKSKIEEQARQYRYNLLQRVCKKYRVCCLFVAHNRGDQLETTLFRLGRSSGINGLAGMSRTHPLSSIHDLGNGSIFSENNARNHTTIVRPLLSTTKGELLATCARFRRTWIHDPSNDNPIFDRVRIRQELMRLESEQGSDILNLFSRFQLIADKAKKEFACVEHAMLRKYIVTWKPDFVTLQRAVFHDPAMFDELMHRILSIIIVHVGNKVTPPRLRSVKRLKKDLQILPKGKQVTLGGCKIKCTSSVSEGYLLEVQPERKRKLTCLDT